MTALKAIETDDRGLLFTCPQCGRRNRLNYERLGQTFRCGQCHAEFPPPAEPIEISDETAFDALTARSALPVVVDFWAPWCGPCKMMAPALAKVAAESAGRWLVAKVNTEDLPGLAQRFGITGLPTLAVFRGGSELTRQAGAMPAPAIRQFLAQVLDRAKS